MSNENKPYYINNKLKVNLPKYVYPPNVITVSKLAKLAENGVNFEIKSENCFFVRELADQKKHGKCLFGGGYLVSDEVAQAQAQATAQVVNEYVHEWKLSEKELNIIKNLSNE